MKKANHAKPDAKASKKPGDLKKVNLYVDEFGQIVKDVKTEDLNTFLDEKVPDKKFSE
jgi:hypothetical protein